MSRNLPERASVPTNGQALVSWLWATCPLWSFGLGTAPAMFWAAVRKRHTGQGVMAVVYLVTTITAFVTAPSGVRPDNITFPLVVLINVVVGLLHGLGARRWVFDIPYDSFDPTPDEVEVLSRQRAALSASRASATARRTARELAETEPMEALRLHVGRIDIPNRDYPDGGLIDVNNVPGPNLIKALGLSEESGERLVRAREAAGGFSSADEVSVLANLPPRALEPTADRLIFLPRR